MAIFSMRYYLQAVGSMLSMYFTGSMNSSSVGWNSGAAGTTKVLSENLSANFLLRFSSCGANTLEFRSMITQSGQINLKFSTFLPLLAFLKLLYSKQTLK